MEKGLSEKEAEEKLRQYGLNEIKEGKKTSNLKILLRQIKNNFVFYLLLGAAIISFFVGKNLTGYTIIGVIVLVVTVGFFQEYKAEKAIAALRKMIMPISIVIRNGKEQEIPSKMLAPGDLVVLRSGERIPADCLILEEKELLVNEAVLTGESKEIRKYSGKSGSIKEENLLFMGSFIIYGKALAQVQHTGMSTKFGKIAGLISQAEKELPLQRKVSGLAKKMATAGMFVALLTGIVMLMRNPDLSFPAVSVTLILVIAIAVASFPEGFPVALVAALASGAYRMAQKNAIVNRMSIIETLGETTVICSDKTGTITKGEMTVKKAVSDMKLIEISGSGYEAEGSFLNNNQKINPLKNKEISLLLRAAVLCNDSSIYRLGDDKNYGIRGTPTEAALLIMAAKAGMYKEDFTIDREEEIPFSSERKIMSVLYTIDRKKQVFIKGALEEVLQRCTKLQRSNGIFTMTKKDKETIIKMNKEMTSSALRTIALAYKVTPSTDRSTFEKDLIFLGFVGMEDSPRDGVKEGIQLCFNAGISVKMITGDHKDTALAIADQVGLHGKAMEGKDIDRLSDNELKQAVRDTVIFARVRPEHKLRIVKALKSNGEIVTMTGDGVNDAPALKEAHIGVAMGKSGTDVSRSVADLTLKDDNFTTMVDAVAEGRLIFNNIQKFATYQVSINVAQTTIILAAVLLGLHAPLVAIQILFINILSDEITAITLAFHPSSKDIMLMKPRKNPSIITKNLLTMLLIAGITMCFGSLAVFYTASQILGLGEVAARTLAFLTLVLFGITNAFNFRSFRHPVYKSSLMSNRYLFYAAMSVLLITILAIYSPLHTVLELVKIPLYYWTIPILISFTIIILFDILKTLNNKNHFWRDIK